MKKKNKELNLERITVTTLKRPITLLLVLYLILY